jgi:DNA-binding beta-propeller fold protein YncE
LQPKSPATAPAGIRPLFVAVRANGANVYVTNAGADSVSQYAVAATGALTPLAPPTAGTGRLPQGIAVHPDGGSVYVANLLDNTVSQYDVGSTGVLAPTTPATVPASPSPAGVTVGPAARLPTNREQCKHGGWREFGFKNQGQCIAFVVHSPS